MKIIYKNDPKKNVVMCGCCGSILEIESDDIELVETHYFSDYQYFTVPEYYYQCPVCCYANRIMRKNMEVIRNREIIYTS